MRCEPFDYLKPYTYHFLVSPPGHPNRYTIAEWHDGLWMFIGTDQIVSPEMVANLGYIYYGRALRPNSPATPTP